MNLPPKGPKVPWPFGVSPMNRADPLGLLEGWARQYGDIFRWRTLHFFVVFVNHPDLIEKVLVSESRNYMKGRGLQANRELFGNGLLTSEGDSWLRQRRLIQPAFHRERIAAHAGTMIEQGRRLVESWGDGETRDVHADLMRATLEIAGTTLFGTNVSDSDAERISIALNTLIRVNSSPRRLFPLLRALPTRANRSYTRAVRQLDEVVYRIIARRRAELGEVRIDTARDNDLLSMLLNARDEDGGRMTDLQLRDESTTLLLASHETTALALTWTLYLLAQHPEVADQLAGELESVLAGRLPSLDDVPRLAFTSKVLKESMRLYPPAWGVVRMCPAECVLGGYRIPKRASVILSQWVMHHDPRYFTDPALFNPSRWTESFERDLPRFAYFPFGGGPRLCIGAGFATMEATLVLAILAQRFRFHVDPTCEVVPRPSITLRPRNGVRLRLEARAARST
ncbi:MAG: cytochrome P450 [Candidatus Acidiferrales bacterium]